MASELPTDPPDQEWPRSSRTAGGQRADLPYRPGPYPAGPLPYGYTPAPQQPRKRRVGAVVISAVILVVALVGAAWLFLPALR